MTAKTDAKENGDIVVVGPKGDIDPTLDESTMGASKLQAGNENADVKIVEQLALNSQVEEDKEEDIEDFDIIIVGAGISGINMAYRTQTMLKGKKYVILERREGMGGTWDLVPTLPIIHANF